MVCGLLEKWVTLIHQNLYGTLSQRKILREMSLWFCAHATEVKEVVQDVLTCTCSSFKCEDGGCPGGCALSVRVESVVQRSVVPARRHARRLRRRPLLHVPAVVHRHRRHP